MPEDSVRVPPEAADRAGNAGDAEATVPIVGPEGARIGHADLARVEDGWRLEIEIDPPPDASGWRAWIERGDCATESGRVVEAAPFAVAGEGHGSATVFPAAWLKPDAAYAVRIVDDDREPVGCGALPTSATGR